MKKILEYLFILMNNCSRCGKICQSFEIHLFRGGEYHRQLCEIKFQCPVSICSVPCQPNDFATYDYYNIISTGPSNEEIEHNAKLELEQMYDLNSTKFESFLRKI